MDHPDSISDFAFSFRRRDGTTRDLIERSTDSPDRGSSHGKREPDREPNSGRPNRGSDRSRTIYRGRNREYSLRDPEVRTLTDVGKFRFVPADDLARFGYNGDRSQMESDVRNLARHGLVEQKTIEGHSSFSTKVLTLTRDGHRLLERAQLVSDRQATHHGLVKPKEARHDADLYRLYQQVARDIEDSGGKVCRVVLDFELKKALYQALSRMRPDKDPRYERIFIANQFDLKVVDGKIPVPDLRIEYEDVGWHTFRHTVGTMLAEMGEHQLTIRDYLRYSNLHVTNKYLQTTPERKRLAQGKLVDAILPGGLLSVNKSTLIQ